MVIDSWESREDLKKRQQAVKDAFSYSVSSWVNHWPRDEDMARLRSSNTKGHWQPAATWLYGPDTQERGLHLQYRFEVVSF